MSKRKKTSKRGYFVRSFFKDISLENECFFVRILNRIKKEKKEMKRVYTDD